MSSLHGEDPALRPNLESPLHPGYHRPVGAYQSVFFSKIQRWDPTSHSFISESGSVLG